MVAYSFKRQFVEPILAGSKDQTMRNERRGRSRHARPGEPLQLYFGMRTQHCRLICRKVCVLSAPVRLVMGRIPSVMVDRQSEDDLDAFALRDGFGDFERLSRFWWDEHRTRVWWGHLIRW